MKRIIFILLLAGLFQVASSQKTFDYLLKGKALIDAGNQDDAVILLTDALKLQTDYHLFTLRASAYLDKRDFVSAISDFKAADKIENGSGSYGLAQTFASKGDVVTSLSYLDINLNSLFKKSEKDILLDPAFKFVENTSEWRLFWKKERYSLFETGLSELEYQVSVGNSTEAESVYNELQKENPAEPDLVYAKALVAYSKKNFSDVINLLSVLPASKTDEKKLRLLAKAQSGSGNYIGAALTYSDLINRQIIDAGLLFLRAECYRKSGDRNKAAC